MKKGFTLIELLAVIVILAIIALIATPIILNIISDAKKQARVRSAELVSKAVEEAYMQTIMKEENKVANSTFTNNDVIRNTKVSNEKSRVVDEDDTDPSITTKDEVICILNSSFILTCKYKDDVLIPVRNIKTGQDLVFKPQYYLWVMFPNEYAIYGSNDATEKNLLNPPENPSSVPPEGENFYLGYDVEDGKISAAYVCFKIDGNEYCLKGGDGGESHEQNTQIIKYAYANQTDLNATCIFNDTSGCNASNNSGIGAMSRPDGKVDAYDNFIACDVYESGTIGCWEYYERTGNVPKGKYKAGDEYIINIGGKHRNFFVLGENEDDSSKVDLIMGSNYTDSIVPEKMKWCKNGDNNSCNHDNLDQYIEHIQQVFGNSVIVSLPSAERLVAIEGYSSVQAYMSSGYPVISNWLAINAVTSGVQGYWTSTPHHANSQVALRAGYEQKINNRGVWFSDVGLRPVITISKDLLEDNLTEASVPKYYSYTLSGNVGTTSAPADADRETEPPTGKSLYLGYDVDANSKVSAAYVCFVTDKEYCLKGYDTAAYGDNQDVMGEAFPSCSVGGFDYECYADDLNLSGYVDSSGNVTVVDNFDTDYAYCSVSAGGGFNCDG